MTNVTAAFLDKLPYHNKVYTPQIVFVGEAAGESEFDDPEKRPFIGASGQYLRTWMSRAGIDPEKVYITNTYKTHPPRNNIKKWLREFPEEGKTHRLILNEELKYVAKNATMIVPIGSYALQAICSKPSIEDYRGSILSSSIPGLEGKKCIPIVHPAAILRKWKQLPATKLDLARIKTQSEFPEIKLPQRKYIIRPSYDTALSYLNTLQNLPVDIPVCVDIETLTTRPNRIVSVQFAYKNDEGFCLPFQLKNGHSYWPIEQEIIIWKKLAQLLTTCGRKLVGHNFCVFDTFMFHMHGIPYTQLLNNVLIDTMEAWQCLQPDLPKSLAFLTSIMTEEPFYKSEGKTWGTKEGEDEFWTYGCKDVCVNLEIAPQLITDLQESKQWDFYVEHYRDMMIPRMNISVRGLKKDQARCNTVGKSLIKESLIEQCKLTIIAGKTINVKSTPNMRDLLYVDMKLPKQWSREGELTADEDAIVKLSTKNPSPIFGHILKLRHNRTLFSNNIVSPTDNDGMFRTSLGFTATGRFTSSGVPMQTGGNLQNINKPMRDMFITTDPSLVFIQADLKQADARVVAWRARDGQMMRIFTSGKDIHKQTASIIFNKSPEAITSDERYTAKRCCHAANYGMKPFRFSQVYNKDAGELGKTLISEEYASVLLTAYHKGFPNIQAVYQQELREIMQRTKTIINPFGRVITLHERVGEELFKAGYADYAQSTVADVTSTIHKRLDPILDIRLQVHDSLLIQAHKNDVTETAKAVLAAANVPIYITGVPELIIPIDIEVGTTWYNMTPISS